MFSLGMGIGLGNNVAATSGGGAPAGVTLVATTGTDKNSHIALSGGDLTATGTGTDGTFYGDRATVAKTGKRQFEITVVTFNITNDTGIYIGSDAGTADLSTATAPQGLALKIHYVSASTSYFWVVYVDGAQADSGALSGNIAVGDNVSYVFDTVGGTIAWYKTRSGITTLITSYSGFATDLATKNKAFIGLEGTNAVTANFGSTAFARTLGGGESAYTT